MCDCSADVFREATTDFLIDSRPLTQVGGDHIKAHIANPSGASTPCFITDNADGTYQVEYTPFEKGELTSAWTRPSFRAVLGNFIPVIGANSCPVCSAPLSLGTCKVTGKCGNLCPQPAHSVPGLLALLCDTWVRFSLSLI